MKLTIAGYGFVGKAHENIFRTVADVLIVDPKFYSNTIDAQSDALVVCVATPPAPDGSCDISNVSNVLAQVPASMPVLIKSTISLDGWRKLRELYPDHLLTFSPEFLREATYLQDINTVTNIWLGGGAEQFWTDVFLCAYNRDDLSITTQHPEELILAKCFRNSFLATKVAFFNQVYDLCEAAGVDYARVAGAISADVRIGNSHTAVTAERGFGGHCFPKDTSATVFTADTFGVDLSLIRQAIQYNDRIRKN
jgi:UDPglucose 6-dehydrogenase